MNRQYPIGPFQYTRPHTPDQRAALIDQISTLPDRLRQLVATLSPAQLDTPYRPGGWTARQVIHHLTDSHMHSLLRFKYALAVDGAPVLAYPEELWAELADVRDTPVDLAMELLSAIHRKWVILLRSMSDAQFNRSFMHPDKGPVTLDHALALYAWHGNHHMAHIALVR